MSIQSPEWINNQYFSHFLLCIAQFVFDLCGFPKALASSALRIAVEWLIIRKQIGYCDMRPAAEGKIDLDCVLRHEMDSE
jgi:hypothetical protein